MKNQLVDSSLPALFKPAYFNDLRQYPNMSFIMIAVDALSLKIIRRLHGICLLCNRESACYDLAFCKDREIWILYSCVSLYTAAMQLARMVQWYGATKVFMILVDTRLGVTYE